MTELTPQERDRLRASVENVVRRCEGDLSSVDTFAPRLERVVERIVAARVAAAEQDALRDAADGVDGLRHLGLSVDLAAWLRNRAALAAGRAAGTGTTP